MSRTGDYYGLVNGTYDSSTRNAFNTVSMRENLEDRWVEGAQIDSVMLRFVRQRFSQ